LRACSDRKKKRRILDSSWPRSHRGHTSFYLVVTLSITVVWLLLACITMKESPTLVNAFVQNINCQHQRQHQRAAHWNTVIQTNHIRQLPALPHRILVLPPLFAKQDNNDDKKDASEKEPSSIGSFFKRKDKSDEGQASSEENAKENDDGKSKGIPIVGRFFATDEEKEEKRRLKEEEKAEKERLKMEANERKQQPQENNNDDGGDNDTEKTISKIVPSVRNYFRERQIRKDGEVLRFQVKRMEVERQKQLEKDAEELRLEVVLKEAERKKKFAKKSPAPEDFVRRKIQSQKEMDRQRKERLETKRLNRGSGVPIKVRKQKPGASKTQDDENDSKSSGSKSQRFGGAFSAAQKFVSGVFDGNSEEWIIVAPKTRISPGEIVAVTAAGIDLLLVASKDGSALHCVANSCPHLGTPLEIGSLERLPIESSGPPSSVNPFGSKNSDVQPVQKESSFFKEKDIARMLKQDGCEDCIVCPLHKTAFALKSGEVRGEWCPYPPVIGKLTGRVKKESPLPVFDVRTKGKNIEVRLNTPVEIGDDSSKKEKKR